LFCNKKKVRTLYSCYRKNTIYEHWREHKTAKKPPYVKLIGAKRNQELIWELALIFPNNRWARSVYVKDSFGRNIEAKIENNKFRIKEIIPYWKEELIYDFDKKRGLDTMK
jgi:hypothetical protein